MTSILNKVVSCYESVTPGRKQATVNLETWLRSTKYKADVEVLRANVPTMEKTAISNAKSGFPLITTAGVFESDTKESLQEYTGLICLDIDKDIANLELKKKEVCSLPYVAYCGLSITGRGLMAIIRVSENPRLFTAHHISLENEVGNVCPSGRSINKMRFYSYDSDAYFNLNPEPYLKIYEAPEVAFPEVYHSTNTYDRLSEQIKAAKLRKIDLTQSDYGIRLKIGFSLVNEFGEDGRALFHAICEESPKYNFNECNRKYTELVKTKALIKINYLFKVLKSVQ